MANNGNRRPGGRKQNGNGNGKPKSNGGRPKNGNGGNGNGKSRSRGNGNGGRTTQRIGIANTISNYRPMVNKVFKEQGSDFLTTVTVRATPTRTERILETIDVSPSAFPGTRITQLSQLYERYRFTSFRLRWVPAIPTTLACQFILYVDTDPLDDPEDAATVDILLRQATAQTGSQQWNFITPKSIPMALRADDQMYYTGDTKVNPRFTLMGRAYLIQVTNPVNFNGDNITNDFEAGSLYIDWCCNFQTPQINPAGYLSTAASLGPDEHGVETFNPFGIVGDLEIILLPIASRKNKQIIYSITNASSSDWNSGTEVTDTGSLLVYQQNGDSIIPSNQLRVTFASSTNSWTTTPNRSFSFGQFDTRGGLTFTVTPESTPPTGSDGLISIDWRVI